MAHGAPAKRKLNKDLHGNETEEEEEVIPPPDGGWGWFVVFGSFMIHVITDGMTYSSGIFYSEYVNYFKEGSGFTSLIGSLLVGVTLCSGPISSAFVNKYGCRTVTIAGSILATICLIASSFAQNVLTLIFTVGIGTGFGLGLIYLPAIVSVTTYFEKYRSLATGIAVCGAGIGTFVFAPLSKYLIEQFTWRGALIGIALIVSTCILFGALFKPLTAPKKEQNAHIVNTELQLINGHKTDDNKNVTSRKPSVQFEMDQKNLMTRSQSVGHSMRLHKQATNNNGNGISAITNQYDHDDDDDDHIGDDTEKSLRTALSQPFLNENDGHFTGSHKSISKSRTTMSRPDILYQGSLYNIPNYRSNHDLSAEADKYGSLRRIEVQTEEKCCGCVPAETKETFMDMLNFELFKDPIFVIFTVSNFCTSVGFFVPFMFLNSHALKINLTEEQGSYLIAIIGIANTVGRIVLGYLADKPWVNRLLVYNLSLTICGVATTFSIFCGTYTTLVLYATVFGFSIGAYVGLTSVILVDLLGLDKLTNAFGLLLLFQGIASLAGPPFAGLLYDLTQSYTPAFIMAGVAITISGVMLFAIPPMQRHYAKKALITASNNNSI